MNSLPVLMYSEDYMSETTRFVHYFVMDFARLSLYILELLSVIIIVYTTIVAFIKLIRHQPFARVYLLHGQSVGLTFKLGAEILRTVVARNIDDIWEIFLLIVIKACMIFLIEWELKGIKDPEHGNGFEDEKMLHFKQPPFNIPGIRGRKPGTKTAEPSPACSETAADQNEDLPSL